MDFTKKCLQSRIFTNKEVQLRTLEKMDHVTKIASAVQENNVVLDRFNSIGNGTCNISRLGLYDEYFRDEDRPLLEAWVYTVIISTATKRSSFFSGKFALY